MKRLILIFAAIGIITLTAITIKPSWSNDKASKSIESGLNIEKYKACIEACNTCITSCKKVKHICKKDDTMAECGKLGKECVTACTYAVEFMNANSILAKSKCFECAKICEKHAIECDKFDMADCKKHAADCRKAAKLCNEI
jgi:hypothetical protein